MAGSDKRKQSLYFPEEMLKEIQDEATAAMVRDVAHHFLNPANHTPTLVDHVLMFDSVEGRYSLSIAVVDKAERGSFKAAVALKCLDCCAFQRAEVAACEITACSLHHLRPYTARRGQAGSASDN